MQELGVGWVGSLQGDCCHSSSDLDHHNWFLLLLCCTELRHQYSGFLSCSFSSFACFVPPQVLLLSHLIGLVNMPSCRPSRGVQAAAAAALVSRVMEQPCSRWGNFRSRVYLPSHPPSKNSCFSEIFCLPSRSASTPSSLDPLNSIVFLFLLFPDIVSVFLCSF